MTLKAAYSYSRENDFDFLANSITFISLSFFYLLQDIFLNKLIFFYFLYIMHVFEIETDENRFRDLQEKITNFLCGFREMFKKSLQY